MSRRAIVINSMGPLDIAAITLVGLSTKRDDNAKIGMFGTGLKYSLAKLLRDKIPFRIWNGDHELNITTQAGDFRGTSYEQVVVDGTPTSNTTDMGPQWETWWIIRELLSNARDETVHEFFVVDWDAVEFKEGWTTFALDYDHFEQVWLNREKYFLIDRQAKWEGGGLKLLGRLGEGTRVYKNGILVHEDDAPDAFDYELDTVELNEMREVRYDWQVYQGITKIILTKLNDLRLVRDYMAKQSAHIRYGKTPYTGTLSTYDKPTLSDAWKEAIDTHDGPITGYEGLGHDLPSEGTVLPQGIAGLIKQHIEKDRPLQLAEPNAEQRAMLDAVLPRMYAANVSITAPIKVADLGVHTVGQALAGNIILNPGKAFRTEHDLVCVLLEEQLHITTGQSDMTRGFQTSIFQTWACAIMDSPAHAKAAPPPTPSDNIDDLPFE